MKFPFKDKGTLLRRFWSFGERFAWFYAQARIPRALVRRLHSWSSQIDFSAELETDTALSVFELRRATDLSLRTSDLVATERHLWLILLNLFYDVRLLSVSSGGSSANLATSCDSGRGGLRREHISGFTRKRSGLGMPPLQGRFQERSVQMLPVGLSFQDVILTAQLHINPETSLERLVPLVEFWQRGNLCKIYLVGSCRP